MARLSAPPLLGLAVALTIGAQSPQQRWAGADEYDLATQAFAEADPDRQVTLLQEWATRYPKTDFERDRLISFAIAFKRAGKLSESFTRATELLSLDPNDIGALLLIAALGPTLPSASDDQIATVTAGATRLLALKLTPTPLPAMATGEQTSGTTALADVETQRVLAFIRQVRKNAPVRADPEVVKRQVAEAALEWAKNLKR